MMIPNIEIPAEKFPQMQLNSIDLQTLHSIQKKVILQKPVDISNSSSNILYHTTAPFYGMLIATVIIIVILAVRRYKKHHKSSQISGTIKTTEEQTYSQPERAKQHPPATFSLNVLK
jgi:preprotein translocase subunit SecG